MSTGATISSSSSSEYTDGLAFRFKLPKGTNFALRAVDIKDGIPKIRFSTSHKVPSITEEDVAVCTKLCLDKERPEFFYSKILPFHPFTATKRWYKYYKPPYLRGTSVGELYAEADWKMKCLNAGVLSDDDKETFQSWSEASKLDGLATMEKFPTEKEEGQVLMTCQSVDVSESEDELLFVGEPKMKISFTGSSSYTDYLTENFDSIAYHDEPSFLKMKEIVKLMLAVEWLRDNGVKFSEEWIKEHTNEHKSSLRKPVQVSFSDEEKNDIMEQLQIEIESALKDIPRIPDLPSTGTELDTFHPKLSLKATEKKVTDSGIEFALEATYPEPIFKALTELDIPVVTRIEARITVDDFDFLFKGIDPNRPITIDKDDGLIRPECSTWAEVFAELMPIPSKKVEDPDSDTQVHTGGCTTSTIPVNKVTPPTTRATETAQANASKSRKQTKIVPLSSQKSGKCPPPRDIRQVCAESSTALEITGARETFGWIDGGSSTFSSSDGKVTEQNPSLRGVFQIQQLIGGKEVGEPIMLHMHLRPPCKKDTLGDSTYPSMRSLAAN